MKKIKKALKYSAVYLALAAALVSAMMLASVIAKYFQSSLSESDRYIPGTYNTLTVSDIVGTDTDGKKYKNDVTAAVNNCGYSVLVRASLIVTWQNSSGEIYGVPLSEGVDYELEHFNSDHWKKHTDGYYYYKDVLDSGQTTYPLIREDQKLKQLADPPEAGYSMHVEIAAESVQAAGTTDAGVKAVTDAWGFDPTE